MSLWERLLLGWTWDTSRLDVCRRRRGKEEVAACEGSRVRCSSEQVSKESPECEHLERFVCDSGYAGPNFGVILG